MKPIVLSGITPSGKLHVGNYLGALHNFVQLQNSGKYNCYFFLSDLHSLTESASPIERADHIIDIATNYLAAGLDPKKSTLFIQSHVPAHAELAWVLNSICPMGELERMTQYKDKSARMETNAGLFTYPALMTADIILYDAEFVPVGDDQDQHLELARTLARKFNSRFGETFIEPKALHTATPRVMSLADPLKKMSKSVPNGCLFLDDEPEVIKKKIMSAVTDSGSEVKFDEASKPGVSNLLMILSAATRHGGQAGKTIPELEKEFAGKNYGQFKAAVAESLIPYLAPIREKKAKLMEDPKKILKAFATGDKKANKVAGAKLKEVYEKVGLI